MFRLYKVKNLHNGITKTFSSEGVLPVASGKGHLPDPTKVAVAQYQCDLQASQTYVMYAHYDINNQLVCSPPEIQYMRYGHWHREDGPAHMAYTFSPTIKAAVSEAHWYLYGHHIDSWEEYQVWTGCSDDKLVALKLKHGTDSEVFTRLYDMKG